MPGKPASPPSFIGDLIERKPVLAGLALVALTLVTHAVILATPGFYSHDEWQKFDHIQLHGFWDFARAYGSIRTGSEFGYPVRPIGFLQQGIAALWMRSAPPVSHLFGVANHALVALTFVWVLRRAGMAGATAALAGALFVLSPLTTMATGWLAASFDQLYILFLLIAAAAIVRLPEEGMSWPRAAWLLLATAAALLAKETAIVAPAVVLLLGYMVKAARPDGFSWRPYGIAFGIALLPVVAYLLYRAPAISASIAGHSTAEYKPDLRNVPANVWKFFTFPFRIKLVEMSAAIFRSPWQPLAASAVHLLLVGAVYRLFGRRFALAYVAAYFVFLVPVLMLPSPGAHYLYGAALAMSLAIAAILVRLAASRRIGAVVLVLAVAGALFAHDLVIQRHFYKNGQCQTAFLASVDTLLAQEAPRAPGMIVVAPDAGAALGVAIRAVAGRDAYIANGRPIIAFESPDRREAALPANGAMRVRMTAACTLRPENASTN
jgi:hypothetical protein